MGKPLNGVCVIFHEFISLTVIEFLPQDLVQKKGLNNLPPVEVIIS